MSIQIFLLHSPLIKSFSTASFFSNITVKYKEKSEKFILAHSFHAFLKKQQQANSAATFDDFEFGGEFVEQVKKSLLNHNR